MLFIGEIILTLLGNRYYSMNLKLLLPVLFTLIISFSGLAQNSASATFTASVTVISPIEINTISNMNFASIDARKGGTVILRPDNTRASNGSVVLDNSTGLSAASFLVKGQDAFSFDIALPKGSYTLKNGDQSITIKDFTSDFNPVLNDGRQTINLGATLEINPDQKPGTYNSSTPLQVTVNYN